MDIRKFFSQAPSNNKSAKKPTKEAVKQSPQKEEKNKRKREEPSNTKKEQDSYSAEDLFDAALDVATKKQKTEKLPSPKKTKTPVKEESKDAETLPKNKRSRSDSSPSVKGSASVTKESPKPKTPSPSKATNGKTAIKREDIEEIDDDVVEIKSSKPSPSKLSPSKSSPSKQSASKPSPKPSPSKSTGSPPKPKESTKAKEAPQTQPESMEIESKEPELKKTYSFRDYQLRPGPPNKGMKEVPTGAPNCLYGKSFIVTGVLDSLERDECIDLIQRYGGTIHKTVVKKLTHAVVGLEAGVSKLKKLKEYNIKIIDEDGLFELIRSSAAKDIPIAKPIPPKAPSPQKTTLTPPKAPLASSSSSSSSSSPSSSSSTAPVALKPIVPPMPHTSATSASSADIDSAEMLWVDKYKPKSTKDLIGNPTPVLNLMKWLKTWHAAHAVSEGNKKAAHGDGHKKAALLSGNPGIGKSTAAYLVVKECGFTPLEFNASDSRNKKSIETHVAQVTENRTVGEFFASRTAPSSSGKKVCLIMDEVDGMSSGDKGGIKELISVIKKSKIPVICICNERSSPKVRSLANHCLDLRFRKPTVSQASARVLEIARREGFAVEHGAIERILESVNCDIRQALNLLQMWRSTSNLLQSNAADTKRQLEEASKDIEQGPFSVLPRLFSRLPLKDKLPLFFVDFSLMPLFMHENYITAAQDLEALSAAADSVSEGDLIDVAIHRNQNWNLLNEYGVISTVRPAALTRGPARQVAFPSWLGKNSSANKKYRLLKEIRTHMFGTLTADKMELRMHYLPLLRNTLVSPLRSRGTDGIASVMEVMEAYGMTKEDWDSMLEISQLGQMDVLADIPSNVKAAFTRTCNNAHHALRAAPSTKSKKAESDDVGSDEESYLMGSEEQSQHETQEDEAEEEEDSIENDKLIKEKKKPQRRKKQESNSQEQQKKPRQKKQKR